MGGINWAVRGGRRVAIEGGGGEEEEEEEVGEGECGCKGDKEGGEEEAEKEAEREDEGRRETVRMSDLRAGAPSKASSHTHFDLNWNEIGSERGREGDVAVTDSPSKVAIPV